MAQITHGGHPIRTSGELPAVGSKAPDFKLTPAAAGLRDLRGLPDVSLADYRGKRKILNIVPSLDTPTCAKSTRRFNESAGKLPNTVVLVISVDLPFASKRFCATEGLENVVPLSIMRNRSFPRDYGVLIEDEAYGGVTARAVVVIDEDDRVIHTELVPEIGQEPDYEKALAAVT